MITIKEAEVTQAAAIQALNTLTCEEILTMADQGVRFIINDGFIFGCSIEEE